MPPMPPGEPEPSDEEIAASERLRDALGDPSVANEDAELARSLRAAFAPAAIAEDENRALVADALADEIGLAEQLRDALGDASIANEDAELARALAAAWAPKPLSDDEHRVLVERAVGRAAAGGAEKRGVVAADRAPRQRERVVRVAFGVTIGALAIAAAFVLVLDAPKTNEAPLARVRSTQPLFREPFKPGEPSARIDTIALARAGDFRDNRFAKWGVR